MTAVGIATPMAVFARLATFGHEAEISAACTYYLGGPPCSGASLWELCCACVAATSGTKSDAFSDAEKHVCLTLMEWALSQP